LKCLYICLYIYRIRCYYNIYMLMNFVQITDLNIYFFIAVDNILFFLHANQSFVFIRSSGDCDTVQASRSQYFVRIRPFRSRASSTFVPNLRSRDLVFVQMTSKQCLHNINWHLNSWMLARFLRWRNNNSQLKVHNKHDYALLLDNSIIINFPW